MLEEMGLLDSMKEKFSEEKRRLRQHLEDYIYDVLCPKFGFCGR